MVKCGKIWKGDAYFSVDVPIGWAIKPGKFALMVGVTQRTLRNWDKAGRLVANRTPTNRRYYTYQQYQNYLQGTGERKS